MAPTPWVIALKISSPRVDSLLISLTSPLINIIPFIDENKNYIYIFYRLICYFNLGISNDILIKGLI